MDWAAIPRIVQINMRMTAANNDGPPKGFTGVGKFIVVCSSMKTSPRNTACTANRLILRVTANSTNSTIPYATMNTSNIYVINGVILTHLCTGRLSAEATLSLKQKIIMCHSTTFHSKTLGVN